TEPRPVCSDDKRRVDADVLLPVVLATERYKIDVTNRRCGAASRRRSAAGMMAAAERQKTKHHSRACADSNAIMIPFVIDEFGQLGKKALWFLDKLAHAYSCTPGHNSSPYGKAVQEASPRENLQHCRAAQW